MSDQTPTPNAGIDVEKRVGQYVKLRALNAVNATNMKTDAGTVSLGTKASANLIASMGVALLIMGVVAALVAVAYALCQFNVMVAALFLVFVVLTGMIYAATVNSVR